MKRFLYVLLITTTVGFAQDKPMLNIVKAYDVNPYARLVEMGKQAQQDGVIKGILLHQGESPPNDSLWTKKVKKVYDNLLAGETVNADK